MKQNLNNNESPKYNFQHEREPSRIQLEAEVREVSNFVSSNHNRKASDTGRLELNDLTDADDKPVEHSPGKQDLNRDRRPPLV